MKTIKDYSDEELRYGIARCEARLSGAMGMGYMTLERVRKALRDYKKELSKRQQSVIEFE